MYLPLPEEERGS